MPLGRHTRDFEVNKPAHMPRLSVSRAWDYIAKLRQHPDVASAEPALIVAGVDPAPEQAYPRAQVRPTSGRKKTEDNLPCSDPHEWSLALCGVPEAWQLPPPGNGKRFGDGIIVGHPDTGYTEHPEIWDPSRLLAARGYDFEDEDSDPRDPLTGKSPSHGTSTASVIMSGQGPLGNSAFVSGVAPRAKLVPLRVSTSVVHLSFKNVAKAVYFAADNNHHVISMSLGGPFASGYLERAIRYAIDQGVILLAAAGNHWPFVVYPAKYDEVLAVAACNCTGTIWSGSAAGKAVDVTGPGESVWRAQTRKNRKYRVARSAGTSYATATSAGICALWLAYHGRQRLIGRYGKANLSRVFRSVLTTSGVDTPPGWKKKKHGAGIVNAKRLLGAPLPTAAPAAPAMARVERLPGNRIDDFYDYFPSASKRQVRTIIANLLQTDSRHLTGELAALGNELLFHIATNPDLRAKLESQATQRAVRAFSSRSIVARDTLFKRSASRALRERLMGAP
jgi:thermitase